MKIREVNENKKQFIALLLLADEQENMIDHYLEKGTMYVLEAVSYTHLDSRNLCCDRSFEHWVWNQYGLDNEISDYYDSSVCSTPTYRYGDSCSN